MSSLNARTILLIEDEENDVFFMEVALKKLGLAGACQVAEDGEAAIRYLGGQGEFVDRRRFPLPALVLLDLKLPRVMGMDVLKWIREQPELDTMVIIVLTSSQQRTDIHAACRLGANSYLVKPANPLALVAVVDLINCYWLHLNQPTATIAASAALSALAGAR